MLKFPLVNNFFFFHIFLDGVVTTLSLIFVKRANSVIDINSLCIQFRCSLIFPSSLWNIFKFSPSFHIYWWWLRISPVVVYNIQHMYTRTIYEHSVRKTYLHGMSYGFFFSVTILNGAVDLFIVYSVNRLHIKRFISFFFFFFFINRTHDYDDVMMLCVK